MTNSNKSFVVLLGLTLLVATLATQESYGANMCPVGGPTPICAANIVPGCVGYKDGTFEYVTDGNRCTYCHGLDENVISFNENQRCPSSDTPTSNPEIPSDFIANWCPVGGPLPACAENVVPGCVGYRDGTFAYVTDGNRCTYCYGLDENVVSFNENEECPSLDTPTSNPEIPSDFIANWCPVGGPLPACAENIVPGCVGYRDGSYEYVTDGNRCTYCYGLDENVVSFNENEECPSLDTPTSYIPTSDIPTSDIPTSEPGVPIDFIPTSDIPISDIPTSYIPTSYIPTSDIPTSDIPTSEPGVPIDFIADWCPVGGPLPICAIDTVPGCVGYRDGSYEYVTDGNRCTYCYGLDKNVVSFNENEECPFIY